ncbi:MAG: Mur ligase family protein [Hyphomonadaceae bacterium]|nr:Mur ligase family protein [Hyphomonadaceae bacterium]
MNPGGGEDRIAAALNAWFGPEFGHGRPLNGQAIRDALAALGDPHCALPPVVHVAGTNGKGSTCAFLAALAAAHGLAAHAFTKPHLLHTRERIRLAGRETSDDLFIAALNAVRATHAPLTHFEAQVAAMFLLFANEPADLTILETGMGGRDDATNVIAQPAACVITPIDLDHVDALGPSLADIAAHKAGILKRGAPAVIAPQNDIVRAVLDAHAATAAAPCLHFGTDWDAYGQHGRLCVQTVNRLFDLPLPALEGAHQIVNAGAAIAAFDAAGLCALDDAACARAMRDARLPGRLQRIRHSAIEAAGGALWFDGAHNPHGARALAQWLISTRPAAPARTIALIAMRSRKDAAGYVEALAPALDAAFAMPLADAEDSASPEALAALARAAGIEAHAFASIGDALTAASGIGGARIIACGSLALARALATG